MKLKKVYNLNENILNPNCHVCGKETSAFSITSEELNTLNLEKEMCLIDLKYLKINGIGQDKHLIFICTNCCKGGSHENS